MMEENQVSIEDERRRFFRIEDLVNLTYEIIDENTLAEKVSLLEKGMIEQFMVMSSLSAITSEMSATIHKIETDHPDTAAYLKALDKKIDLIGKAFMLDEVRARENQAAAVNLSASGIAFNTNDKLKTGDHVELKIMLMPSCTGILTYGEIVACEKHTDSTGHQYQVRINFSHLRDEDRDMLIKHVIRKQGDMLRERRAARENTPE